MSNLNLPNADEVIKAAARLRPVVAETAIITNVMLDARLGGRGLLKPETLQRTGSFKFRGAYNRLVQLSPDECARGVVAFSSGNHAQGVAYAAKLLGIPATIVMPADAPALKIANTRGYGAEVVLYDRARDDREAIAHKIVAERGATVVPPFDDPHIIAGQGTVGLELADWATAHGIKIDQVLVCCSGGGLAAGIALGFEARGQKPDIYAVEPEGFDDYGRSLIAGERVSNTSSTGSICDALMSQSPGKLTFAINQPRLKGGLAISDDEARRAVAFAFQTLKLVVEPGGAAALAAALAGKLETRDRVTAIILSGGNVDAAMFDQCLAAA